MFKALVKFFGPTKYVPVYRIEYKFSLYYNEKDFNTFVSTMILLESVDGEKRSSETFLDKHNQHLLSKVVQDRLAWENSGKVPTYAVKLGHTSHLKSKAKLTLIK